MNSHLKADKTTEKNFLEKGLTTFEYNKGNKKVKMSYLLATEEIYDDPNEATFWAKLAYEAALSSKTKK